MKKIKINKGFIIQKMDNMITIFDGEKSVLYTFNKTATFIFEKIKSGLEPEKIIEDMRKKYAIKKDRAKKDLDELVNDLISKKIISEH